jgi:hypothetical protein
MVSMHKTCPRCGEEYVASVRTCVECGVPLDVEAPAAAMPAPAAELPPLEALVALRNAEVRWIEELAERLAGEGIPSRVELPDQDDRRVQGRGMGAVRCTLYVRREDAEPAARIDAEFARTQVPDLPAETQAGWAEAEGCPGCSAPLAPDAQECLECGLAFGAPE